MKMVRVAIRTVVVVFSAAWSCSAQDLGLENAFVEFRFSERHGFALESVTDKRTGVTFSFDLSGKSSLWAVSRMDEMNCPGKPRPGGAPRRWARRGNALTFEWDEAVLSVRLPEDSGLAEWRMEWKGSGAWPYSFAYPALNVQKVGEADRLYYPQRLGKVLEDPVGREFGVIPISPNWWSSQFVLLSASPTASRHRDANPERTGIDGFVRGARQDESTLYLSADDPAYWRKEARLTGRKGASSFKIELTHYPAWQSVPRKLGEAKGPFEWKAPYAVHFGVVSGGVDSGVETYRKERGFDARPVDSNSPIVTDRPAWRSIHLPPAELTKVGRNLRDYYRVPVVMHHYENTLERFNYHFSEFLSYKAHFREECEYLRSIDCSVMPYFNVVRFDRTLTSYVRSDGDTTAIRDMNGTMRGDPFKGVPDTLAAWGDPTWTRLHQAYARHVFGRGKVRGYYMDEGCGSARLDYNVAAGRIHGGTYICDGFRAFSDVVRGEARKIDPQAFLVTEGFGEHLIGHIDGFLLYGLRYPSGLNAHARGFDHFPLFSLVHHGRTTGVSDQPVVKLPVDMFRLGMAQAWAWGLQTQANGTDEELSEEHREKTEYCRELVRSSWQIGGKYLSSGRMVFSAVVENREEIGTASIGVVAKPYEILYGKLPWRGPEVLTGAYRDEATGDCALALANVRGSAAAVRVVRDSRRFAAGKRKLYRSWPLPVVELPLADEFAFTVPGNGVAILEWRDDAPVPRALLDKPAPLPDWVATCDSRAAAEVESARTYMAEFIPGALCVTDAREKGVFETAMLMDNRVASPLSVVLEPGGTYHLKGMSEALLPVSVRAVSSKDGVVIPVRVSAPGARPSEDLVRFVALQEPPANSIANLKTALKYPVAGVKKPLPFTVSKGARTFSFYPGVYGEVFGILRDPEGRAVSWGAANDTFLAGTRYSVEVPPGMDGREWTYEHVGGKAFLSFGDGVEPMDRSVLGAARAPEPLPVLGFYCAPPKFDVSMPASSPGQTWSERLHLAFHGKWPETLLRCDFAQPVAGRVTCPIRIATKGGCRVYGYLQAFVRRPDGSFDVVTGPQEERKARKGRAELPFAIDLAQPVSSLELVLRFTGSPAYDLTVLPCERKETRE